MVHLSHERRAARRDRAQPLPGGRGARADRPDLRRGRGAGRRRRGRDPRPEAAAEPGRQDVRLQRRCVVGLPGAQRQGGWHPVLPGRLHGQRERPDPPERRDRLHLRARPERRVRDAQLHVQVALPHRPEGRLAQLLRLPGHLRAARLPGLLLQGHGHGLDQGRDARHRVQLRPLPRQDPDQHARRLHGPRAQVARLCRLDPADAHRRQPRQQADRRRHHHVLPGRGGGRAALDGRRSRGAGRRRD
mmetsp:Transcript_41988/g.136967  ORF Transcript_41988/g.136967 Transcript_41988/m.136967 type:complete len:246 (-) Transcript_41988:889-1626(-)